MARPETKQRRHHLDRRAGRLADKIEGAGAAEDLLTSRKVADDLDVTEPWMWLSRSNGYGPSTHQTPFPEVVRYKRRDVVRWLRGRARVHAASMAVREDA